MKTACFFKHNLHNVENISSVFSKKYSKMIGNLMMFKLYSFKKSILVISKNKQRITDDVKISMNQNYCVISLVHYTTFWKKYFSKYSIFKKLYLKNTKKNWGESTDFYLVATSRLINNNIWNLHTLLNYLIYNSVINFNLFRLFLS